MDSHDQDEDRSKNRDTFKRKAGKLGMTSGGPRKRVKILIIEEEEEVEVAEEEEIKEEDQNLGEDLLHLPKLTCKICGEIHFDKKKFNDHVQSHKTEACPHCSTVVKKKNLKRHVDKCKENPQGDLQNFYCDSIVILLRFY